MVVGSRASNGKQGCKIGRKEGSHKRNAKEHDTVSYETEAWSCWGTLPHGTRHSWGASHLTGCCRALGELILACSAQPPLLLYQRKAINRHGSSEEVTMTTQIWEA